ncbi:MAG: GNAT family protein [Salinivirgaceae bacterium]|nr:GNAT family protein [Salinivirgaceae bacterium]
MNIRLRRVRESDRPHFKRWLAIRHLAESMWLLRSPDDSLPEATDELAGNITKRFMEESVTSIIVEAESNRQLGYVGFKTQEKPGVREIFFAVGEEDRLGKGIGKKAVQLAIEELLTMEKVKTITAEAFEFSEASIRTLEKCGFEPTGVSPVRTWKNGRQFEIRTFALEVEDQEEN